MQSLGSKGGKKDRKLTFLNKKRSLKNKEIELELKKENQKRKSEEEKKKIVITEILNEDTIKKYKYKVRKQNIKEIITDKSIKKINKKQKQKIEIINVSEKLSKKPKNIIDENQNRTTKETKQKNNTKKANKEPIPLIQEKEIHKNVQNVKYLQKEIIHILEENVKENIYQLKKVDSEIHTIQKKINTSDLDSKELESIELEIQNLIEKLKEIQKKLESLEKTFDLEFPVTEPDNYLIYLIDEYKDNIRTKKEFSENLKDNKYYKSIIEKITELEIKKDSLLEQVEEKKQELEIENDRLERLNENLINIDEQSIKIKQLLEKGYNDLDDITIKLNESVHITEKVDFITKRVEHTLFDLFLLMTVLRHNLSIKNNAVSTIMAAVTLDLIIKMCTPIKEEVRTKVSDVKDYEKMIDSCIDNTENLLNIIKSNLTQIESLRYTFEHDYKNASSLPLYKEVLTKLTTLEEEMKDRFETTNKLTRDTKLQLEKNNAKVKKYKNLEAA